ncbi:MAG: hypothetical protein U0637_09520 [Phycisphaerales bacterium]
MDAMSLPIHPQQSSCSCAGARVWFLAGMYALGAVVGAIAGGGLAAFNGWGAEGGSGSGTLAASVLAGGSVLVTALAVLGVFRAMRFGMVATQTNPRPSVQPAMLTGMSAARMLGSLVVALGVYLVFKPEGRAFWVSFLLGGLLALMIETAWSVRWLRAGACNATSPSNDGAEAGS